MIPYEVYKVIHLFSLILFFSSAAVQLISKNQEKVFKILGGVSTLLVLVSGMGLLARVGISHGQSWPLWAMLKVFFWLALAVMVPVSAKRFPNRGRTVYAISMGLFLVAVIVVNYKP